MGSALLRESFALVATQTAHVRCERKTCLEKKTKLILTRSTSSQCIKIHRVIAEEPWQQKIGCWLVLSVLQDQTSVGRWCFSICPLCVLKWLQRFEINFPFVNFKTTFTGKCLRPVYRDCRIHDLDQRNYIEDGRHAGLRSCVWGDKPRGSVFSRHICYHCCFSREYCMIVGPIPRVRPRISNLAVFWCSSSCFSWDG